MGGHERPRSDDHTLVVKLAARGVHDIYRHPVRYFDARHAALAKSHGAYS
jgi:hypothetical protein